MPVRQRQVRFDKKTIEESQLKEALIKPKAGSAKKVSDLSHRPLLFFLFLFLLSVAAVMYDPKMRKLLFGMNTRSGLKWWQTSIVYQVYPRSFQDSNSDGIGDLRGVLQRLDHFQYLGVGAIWLSPFYTSPMVDFGYDVANFTEVDPMFGTMLDFEELVEEAHDRGIKVIMDFIPNHSSDQHPWFIQSARSKAGPYADYYMWHDGIVLPNGTRAPPNNWISVFGGSMWEWNPTRKQYYLHQFTKEQPDLNFRNPKVHKDITEAMEFWLKKGVDGYRVDAIRHMYESADITQDEPRSYQEGTTPEQYEYYQHPQTVNLPEVYQVIARWKKMFTQYERLFDKDIFMVVEVYGDSVLDQIPYYHSGADMPFNFNLIFANRSCGGYCMQRLVESWMDEMPEGKWPNWVTGNHDQKRITHKMGDEFVNAMNILLLLLPGTPTTYYGEEIGMKPIQVSYEETQDPHGRNFGPERYEEFSRDPCRSPMQWNDEKHAGFSNHWKTWLPVHPQYYDLNVEAQKKNPKSPVELYRKLARLRTQAAFQDGDIDTAIANDNIYSFIRFTQSRPAFLVIVNLGKESSTDNYRAYSGKYPPPGKFVPGRGSVVLNTQNFKHDKYDMGKMMALDKITLEPGQGLVIKFWPGY